MDTIRRGGWSHSWTGPPGGKHDPTAERLSGCPREPRWRCPAIYQQQYQRRNQPRHLPQRLLGIQWSAGGQPRSISNPSWQPSNACIGVRGTVLTNLMHLNVDTSWFIRYRSTTNPVFRSATFPQAITITNRTAIPRHQCRFCECQADSGHR